MMKSFRQSRLLHAATLAGLALLPGTAWAQDPAEAPAQRSTRPPRLSAQLEQTVKKLRQSLDKIQPTITVPEGPMRSLLVDRYNTSIRKMRADLANFEAGRMSFDQLDDSFDLIRISGEALGDKPESMIKLLELDVELSRMIETFEQGNVERGAISRSGLEAARYHRLETEIRLLRARESSKKS